MTIILVIVMIVLIEGLNSFVGNAVKVSPSKHESSYVEGKCKYNIKILQRDVSEGIFSTDFFIRLHEYSYILEYLYYKILHVHDCYVCTYLPASAGKDMTYNHLPLTFALSCSLGLSFLYHTQRSKYWFPDYDMVLRASLGTWRIASAGTVVPTASPADADRHELTVARL